MSWSKLLVLILLSAASAVQAQMQQTDDPLSLTLPTGKVLHFQTSEQKAKFEAGLQQASLAQTTASAASATSPASAPNTALQSAVPVAPPADGQLDLTPVPGAGSGIPSNAAPIYTAKYYLANADSWVGKRISLSVISVVQQQSVKAGLVQLLADTWNNATVMNAPAAANGKTTIGSNGKIAILAKPIAAGRLMSTIGTIPQVTGFNGQCRTTMVNGVVGKYTSAPGTSGRARGKVQSGYCLYVE